MSKSSCSHPQKPRFAFKNASTRQKAVTAQKVKAMICCPGVEIKVASDFQPSRIGVTNRGFWNTGGANVG
jgi:hypothetical protein